ncbi:MAG: DUF5132 domain-containing protein [Methylocapsa sp.]|nr:DUF5132 domain-containing protein [Methylocapsa sp.]
MADLKDMLGEGAGPVALGAGAIILAPTLFPLAGRILRPVAKGAIKTGMWLYRETFAVIAESASDLVAEARSELEAESQHAADPKKARKAAAT